MKREVVSLYRVTVLTMGGVIPVDIFEDKKLAEERMRQEKQAMNEILGTNLHAPDSKEPIMSVQDFLGNLGVQKVHYVLRNAEVKQSNLITPNAPSIIKA